MDDGLEVQLVINDRQTEVISPEDLYKFGISLKNSEILHFQPTANLMLERLVCSNGCAIAEKDYRYSVRRGSGFDNIAEHFFNGINNLLSRNISLDRFVRERISRHVNVNMSLRELEACDKLLRKTVDSYEEKIPNYDNLIPLKVVAEKYNLEFPIKRSDRWKATASTPVNSYKMYNDLTKMATHHRDFESQERSQLQVGLGGIFLSDRNPDMLDIAPQVQWN
jgi:hypothetical protein